MVTPVGLDHLKRILLIADQFVAFLSDQEKRESVESIETLKRQWRYLSSPKCASSHLICNTSLLVFLLDSRLKELGRKYLTF